MEEIAEKQSDAIPYEIIRRYTIVNDCISDLTADLCKKRIQKSTINRYLKSIEPMIIGIIGMARTNKKFYSDIESKYMKFVNNRVSIQKKGPKYEAETIIELWEIIKNALIEFKVIELGND